MMTQKHSLHPKKTGIKKDSGATLWHWKEAGFSLTNYETILADVAATDQL